MRLTPAVEASTGIQKEIDLVLCEGHVEVTHRLYNRNPWPVELAPWALTVMAQNGMALVPNRRLTLWPYTDMADPRVTWGERYIVLRQDPLRERRFKVGLNAEQGWVAYVLNGDMFVKGFAYLAEACYPDFGVSCELFTNDLILEVESLGPLTRLEPGCYVEHVEHWYLFEGVETDGTETSIDAAVMPHIGTITME